MSAPENGVVVAEPAESSAGPAPSAPLPPHVVSRLIDFALRTEPGQALWEGYAVALAGEHPWIAGRVAFHPGPGVVTPAPPAPEPDRRQ